MILFSEQTLDFAQIKSFDLRICYHRQNEVESHNPKSAPPVHPTVDQITFGVYYTNHDDEQYLAYEDTDKGEALIRREELRQQLDEFRKKSREGERILAFGSGHHLPEADDIKLPRYDNSQATAPIDMQDMELLITSAEHEAEDIINGIKEGIYDAIEENADRVRHLKHVIAKFHGLSYQSAEEIDRECEFVWPYGYTYGNRNTEPRPLREYKVRWEIEVDAESAEGAAKKALKIQRDPMSFATVFEVNDNRYNTFIDRIDLSRDGKQRK